MLPLLLQLCLYVTTQSAHMHEATFGGFSGLLPALHATCAAGFVFVCWLAWPTRSGVSQWVASVLEERGSSDGAAGDTAAEPGKARKLLARWHEEILRGGM